MVNDPDVVLADEPTGALDSKTSVQVMELLKEVAKDKLVIMVTHNPNLATEYSTRIIKFLDGELIDDSAPFDGEEINIQATENQEVLNDTIVEAQQEKSENVVREVDSVKSRHKKKERAFKKTTMSFWTALSLSFKNLLTKKARTIMVAIAGSIGIFGIALILALSSGFQAYINKTQEDTLASYPITINKYNVDPFAIMMSLFTSEEIEHEADGIYAGDTMSGVFEQAANQMENVNDLDAFSKYIEEHKSELESHVSAIQYTYDYKFYVTMNGGKYVEPKSNALYDMIMMYAEAHLEHKFGVELNKLDNGTYDLIITNATDEGKGFIAQYVNDAEKAELFTNNKINMLETRIVEIISSAMSIEIEDYASMDMGLFNEMIDNPTLLKSQYELLGSKSKWATESNEVMLVLNQNSEMDDYQLYCLGLISRDDMKAYMANIFAEEKQQYKIAYNDIIGKEYKILLDGDYYIQVGEEYKDIRTMLKDGELTQTEYDEKYNAIVSDESKGKVIKIAGVVRLNEQTSSGQLSTGIAYLSSLTNEMISYQNGTPAVTSGAMDEVSKVPTSVNFYASSFESKDEIENFITRYNESVEEEKQIDYTDYVGLMMSSISTIISAISYILIAFVSISLIVSSIMIGIITYISVLERIKEIGILRAVGASKRDIKRVFTAETLIIGLISGVLGVLMALILTIPVNIIINALAGISGVAKLPVMGAVILIAISMILTFIAGLIPAKIASKKDPVVALRTE